MSTNQQKNSQSKNLTMEELLASQIQQPLVSLFRGKEVEGEIVSITDKEITLDLGSKSEGIINIRDIPQSSVPNLKVGGRLKAFVNIVENEHGQAILSMSPVSAFDGVRTRSRGGKTINWSQFITAYNRKSKLSGKVLEINKGGLIVEVAGVRGFLPNSQVGFELMSKAGAGLENLIGENLAVTVIEIDQKNNKLIFSQRGPVSEEVKAKLQNFKKDQKIKGKIIAVLPFGLVVGIDGSEGLVFISDVSWDKVADLSVLYTSGQEIDVVVLGVDLELGRLNLSIKHLTSDPFEKLAEIYPADEVVKGEITQISPDGVVVSLKEGIEGFLPASKMSADTSYEAGKQMSFLVDSVDTYKRRINLAPFVTSTAGLIYK